MEKLRSILGGGCGAAGAPPVALTAAEWQGVQNAASLLPQAADQAVLQREQKQDLLTDTTLRNSLDELGKVCNPTMAHTRMFIALRGLLRRATGMRFHLAAARVVVEVQSGLAASTGEQQNFGSGQLVEAAEFAVLADETPLLGAMELGALSTVVQQTAGTVAAKVIHKLEQHGAVQQSLVPIIQSSMAGHTACTSTQDALDVLKVFSDRQDLLSRWPHGKGDFHALQIQLDDPQNVQRVGAEMRAILRGEGSVRLLVLSKVVLLEQLQQVAKLQDAGVIVAPAHMTRRGRRQLRNMTAGLEMLFVLVGIAAKCGVKDDSVSAVARVLGVLAPAFHPVYRLMHGARTTVADALATQPELLSEEGDDVAAIAAGMRFLGQLLEQQAGLQQTADAAAATAQKALEEVEKLKSQMKDGQLASVRRQLPTGAENEAPEGVAEALGKLELNAAGPLRTNMAPQP